MTGLRGLRFALLDDQANVLCEGPMGKWVEVIRTGHGDTIQVDLSDGSLLLNREKPPTDWSGYTMSGNFLMCDWPPRPEV